VASPQTSPDAAYVDERQIWVVAVAGEYVNFHGTVFSWGILVYDYGTGAPVASFAGEESWPPFRLPRIAVTASVGTIGWGAARAGGSQLPRDTTVAGIRTGPPPLEVGPRERALW
jgi:hypothetical protein